LLVIEDRNSEQAILFTARGGHQPRHSIENLRALDIA
jgi:hypothetical protein